MKINKLIYPLEPRIMLDGAAAVDVIDNVDDILQIKKTQTTDSIKFIEQAKETSLPFVNVERDQRDQKNRNIVFIDAAVQDYQTLVNAFDAETEVHIIQSNQDGFLEMQNYLVQENDVDAIHIIGHGSAGQIAFGTALLNESTLEEYKSSLSIIGASLTADGDILFYGCNIADGKTGETLINQIATITNADIAASDDVTGQGGDWDLEKHTGIIETKNIVVEDYKYALDSYGVDSIDSSVVAVHNATNFEARWSGDSTNRDGQRDPGGQLRFILSQERASVTSGTGRLSFDYGVAVSSFTPSTSNPVHVYMLFSNDYTNNASRRNSPRTGVVTFDNEILGVFSQPSKTIAMTGISKSGATYPTSSSSQFGKRDLEYNNSNPPGQSGNGDWFAISNSNKTITIGTKNGYKGDFVRIITRAPVSNNAPAGNNDAGYINEDATLSVSNGASANDSTPDTSGEHTGDVLLNDTDADSDTLTVTAISGGSLGSALRGTYGQITLYSNGSYTYVANQNAADALDPGDTATDTFTYTVSDGTDTDTATITITIAGLNDNITAVNHTEAVNEDKLVYRTTSSPKELDHDATDPDGDDASGSFTITAIRTGRESGSGTAGSIGTLLIGTYGQLTVNSDGSYRYRASTSGADGLSAGATAIDYFTYTVQDHSGGDTDTAEIAITVTGVGPQAVNDTGSVNENATLSKNEAQGVISNDDDNASYDSESLAVTAIRAGAESGSGTSGTVGSALTGTYGVLTIAADGSYSYVANTAAAEALDANDEVTDVFTYTVSDDADVNSDTGQITITITGVDDDPTGVNDTGSVNEDATLSVNTSSGVLSNDTDADDSSSLSVSAISSGTVGQAKNGTYGALTLNANGSYTYVANQSGADGLAAGATATDTFTYTVSDGAGTTDTATLTITVTGIGPQGVDDTGSVNEDATLTVNAANGVVGNDDDNSSYDSESLAVTAIRAGAESGSGTAGSIGSALTGTYGQLTIAADGSYSYVANQDTTDTLDAGDTVTDTFTYTVKDDSDKNADTAELVITVTGVDDDPTGVNDTGSVNEDATLSVNTSSGVLSNDTDADDASSLSVSAISGGTVGSALTGDYGDLTLNANGSYTYVANHDDADALDPGDTDTDVFTYTVSDGAGTTDTATLTITVTGVNDDIVAVDDTDAVTENGSLNRSTSDAQELDHDDTDADGDDASGSFTITAIRTGAESGSGTAGTVGQALTGTYGVLTVASTGAYTYAANTNASEALDVGETVTDIFTYTVRDHSSGDTDTAQLTITVTGANDDITAVNDTDALTAGSTVSRTTSDTQELDHDDTDVDDDDVPGNFTITAIRLGATEGSGTAKTLGSAFTTNYGTVTINADGSYTYVADQSGSTNLNNGTTATDSFNYTVRDHASGDTDTATLVITITGTANTAPEATNDTGYIVEDGTLSVGDGGSAVTGSDSNNNNESGDTTGDVLVGDTDADSDTLTVSAISGGSVGSGVTGTYGTLTIQSNGSYEYVADQSAADTLDAGDEVTDVFTYTVSDGNDGTDTATLTFTILGIDDDPVGVNDTGYINEDATLTVNDGGSAVTGSDSNNNNESADTTGDVLANDTDADGSSSLTVSAISGGTVGQALTGTYGTLTLNANGSYTYVTNQSGADGLAADATATDTFTYTVSDGAGTTDTATLTITVKGVGPAATNDTGSVNEDATLSVNSGSGVTSNDTGGDTESLELTNIRTGTESGSGTSGSVGSALTGTYGQLTIAADGSYTYVANQNAADALDPGETATDTFTYTVKDDDNKNADTGEIVITITGVNDDITAVDDTDTVTAGTTITRSTSDTQELDHDDTDPDADDVSGSFTVTAIRTGTESGSGANKTVGSSFTTNYGTVTINADGSYTYAADQSGAIALDDGATAIDYFTYTVRDHSSGDTDTGQLAITVTGVNEAPVGVNDTGVVNEDATLSLSAGNGTLSNDTDADSDALSVTALSGGSVGSAMTGTYGTLTLNSNGSYAYVADQNAADALDAGDTVTDTFTYTVSDGTATDTATLSITISGENDDIIAIDDTDSVNEDETINRTVNDAQELDADDTDADTDDIQGSFTITAIRTGTESGTGTSGTIGQTLTGTYGTLTVNADGSYTYVADQNAADSLTTGTTGVDTFTYTVSDGTDTDTAQISFTVTGINDNSPVAVNDSDSVNRDATIERAAGSTFDINADDTDTDGDSLTISEIRVGQTEGGGASGTIGSALVGTYGTLTLNSDGSYTYAADQDSINGLKRGDSVIDYFNYTVSDGTNEDIGVIAITVNGISDPPVPVDDTLAIDASAQTTKDSSSGVLVNDTDPDGDTITVDSIRTGQEAGTGTTGTVGSVMTGEYGDLIINSDGSYTYQANNAKSLNPGETATDYFTYTATDTETTVPAQISITINGINDPPEVIRPINVPTLLTGQNIVIKYRQAFNDPDFGSYDIAQYKVIDPESESETSLPTGLYIEGNKIKGKIKTSGDYSITLRAIDGAGLYVDHTFTIKVVPAVNEISKSADNEKPVKLKTIKVKPKKDFELNLAAFDNSDIPQVDEMVLEKKLTFNGGMKVLNVIAQETQTTNELNVEVMVNDDNRQDVESYSGLLSDGKPLPEWVKVNPDTGETSATMPDDIDNVEVQVIALDKDGTVRDINIVLDKPVIKNDSQILRNDSNLFQGENIFVDGENKVTFVDDTIDRAARNSIELNKARDEIDFMANLKLGNIAFSEGQYSINFIDDNKSNVSNYRIELDSGKSIPMWLSLNNKTGEILATPPSDEKVISIKLIAEDEDGTERTIEVDIDFEEVLQSQEDLSYVPLNNQINEIVTSADNYGERLINQLG